LFVIYCYSPGGDTAAALTDGAFYMICDHLPQHDTAVEFVLS